MTQKEQDRALVDRLHEAAYSRADYKVDMSIEDYMALEVIARRGLEAEKRLGELEASIKKALEDAGCLGNNPDGACDPSDGP